MPASLGTLPPGTRLEEFEILGVVGEGGFGVVYRGRDHSLERDVALKEYLPSALATRSGHGTVSVKSGDLAEAFAAGLRSFVNEARMLARLDHPSLVKVYRFWEASGTAYMVMPLYDGVTLKETLLALGGPPTELWITDLLRRLLDALAYLHRAHCFHRDIAPDNILILKDGRPVLLDFGAARRVIGDMTLTVILKPGYAPVEQYGETCDLKQGPWTDIYALAAVAYFAITGKTPPPAVARMLSDSLEPLATLVAGRYSDRLLKGLDRGLAVTPAARPRDVGEFRTVLGLDDLDSTRTAPPVSEKDLPADVAAPDRLITFKLAHTRERHGRKLRVMTRCVVAGALLGIAGACAWLLLPGPITPLMGALEPQQRAGEDSGTGRLEMLPTSALAPPAMPSPSPAPREQTRPREAARTPPSRTPSPRTEASSGCTDIVERASLGEPLTSEEQATLARGCR